MTFIQTFSGMQFDLLDPKVEDVCLEDIAGPLSRQCRWNGQCRCFYSVAQHSMHVADLLRRRRGCNRSVLIGLLHDAHEAYTGDIVSPLMRMLYVQNPAYSYGKGEQDFVEDGMYGVQARISQVIFSALIPGMPDGCETPVEGRAWNRADQVALLTEVRDLFAGPLPAWTKGIDAQPDCQTTILEMQPQVAEELFCEAYNTLRDRVEREMEENG